MKVTLKWLKDFIDIDLTPEELANKLTNSGNEVEEIIYQDRFLKHVVVGKILDIQKHPNADKLVVCKVDIGEMIQIVTAAKNIKVGDKVPVSLPGADLANGIHIEKSKLRGVESNGMFCSIEELGVTDYDGDANGIMILDDDAVIGEDIAKTLLMDDVIFDINVTANRPDCMSVIGIAHEISALTGKPLKKQNLSYETCDCDEDVSNYINVIVKDEKLCPRYIACAVKDVKIEKSPRWLRARLVSVGIKPINNIVDITNYVLVEYGQPMHAFDYDYIDGKQIIVRSATDSEKILTLNHNTYDLDNSMLCICDKNKPIVIAGIIGGMNSCVEPTTKTTILESACFDRASIRRTSRKIGVRTDSTARFEKGVDCSLQPLGMKRALNLVYKLNAGKIIKGEIDTIKEAPKDKTFKFSLSKIFKLLGVTIPNDDVLNILNNLGIKSSIKEDELECLVPYYRQDIECDADIAEELIRIYGYEVYDNIDAKPLSGTSVTIGKHDSVLYLARSLKQQLCSYGFYETVNFSICSVNDRDKLLIDETNHLYNMIKIANPISEDIGYLRTTMANSMFNTVAYNLSHKNDEFRLFEVGRVYLPKQLPLTELPDEINILSFCSVCKRDDFFVFKGVVENLLRDFDISYDLVYSSKCYLHKGISADIIDKKTGKCIGSFGKVHPKVAENFDISPNTYYGELNLDFLSSCQEKKHSVQPISKYPYVDRDLAIVCDEDVTVKQILDCVKKSCGKLYYSAKVFDIYRSSELNNKKSVAFSFRLESKDKTLTDDEINQVVHKILKDLEFKLKAVLR